MTPLLDCTLNSLSNLVLHVELNSLMHITWNLLAYLMDVNCE